MLSDACSSSNVAVITLEPRNQVEIHRRRAKHAVNTGPTAPGLEQAVDGGFRDNVATLIRERRLPLRLARRGHGWTGSDVLTSNWPFSSGMRTPGLWSMRTLPSSSPRR
jgi:hypothetical protein